MTSSNGSRKAILEISIPRRNADLFIGRESSPTEAREMIRGNMHPSASWMSKSAWQHPAFGVTLYQGELGKSVRAERWHYVEWDDGKAGAMLFDHSNDPLELKNLAADPIHMTAVQDMKKLLR